MAVSRTTPSSSSSSSGGILAASVATLRGVGPDSAKLLERIGIRTVADLLWHLPRRYDDFSKVVPLRSIREGAGQTAVAIVGDITSRRGQRGMRTEMTLRDESGMPSPHRAVWFGRQFIEKKVQEGQTVRLSGKTRWFGRGLSFENPQIEPADREAVHTGRIVPVYQLTEGLKPGHLRRWMHTAVAGAHDAAGRLTSSALLEHVPDRVPPAIRERHDLPPIAAALSQVHFPDDPIALFKARRRLAFDELLTLQVATAQRRARWVAEANALPLEADDPEVEAWVGELPFSLTDDQKRAFAQIRADLARATPMSRLLEGDVGSGKTVVAALAMRIAFHSGAQAALMAPTEMLAAQHAATLERLFAHGGPKTALLTSAVRASEREAILERLRSGSIDAVVGTHALIEEGVAFRRLGLVVVDEQHRFGVKQRAALREKGPYPHVLFTTATPIPQTLAQTIYRDLDLSVLEELPAGRQPIRTEVREPDALPKVWPWLKERVALGEQAFVVCPRIDPDDEAPAPDGALFAEDATPVPSAVATEQDLRRGALAGVRVGLVHGRMPPRERESVMARFRDRDIDVLVATTVIEVGIDIPDATVMVVLGAERFGLAQLHQLRGRVGRAEKRSYCVLISASDGSERLAAMSQLVTRDGRTRPLNGFELAQKDLEIRGPGQFLGAEQSGFADQLRVVDLTDIDPRLLDDVKEEVDRIVATDVELTRPEHAGLREAVDELWRRYAYA